MLHIGTGSWNNPQLLDRAIKSVQANTVGEFKLLVYDNASTDPAVRPIIEAAAAGDPRVIPQYAETNSGYVGAVNACIKWAEADGGRDIAWLDQDIQILEHGWDQKMVSVLDTHHDVAMVGPECFASYKMDRAGVKECLWTLGCLWVGSVARFREIGYWDESMTHQNECHEALRLRLAGWRLACVTVQAKHEAHATNSPEAQDRINRGVIAFVDHWNRYFCGPHVNYFSSNVLRWENWPPVALYLEAYWQELQRQGKMPLLNRNPEQVLIEGQRWDLCVTPRWENLYRDRLV